MEAVCIPARTQRDLFNAAVTLVLYLLTINTSAMVKYINTYLHFKKINWLMVTH